MITHKQTHNLVFLFLLILISYAHSNFSTHLNVNKYYGYIHIFIIPTLALFDYIYSLYVIFYIHNTKHKK